MGRGSTSQILSMSDKRARAAPRDHAVLLKAVRTLEKIVEVEIEKDEAVRGLWQLTGSTKFESQK